MWRTLVVIAVLALLGISLWIFRAGGPEPAEMVPASLLVMLVINDFPESMDFLPQTKLGEWLDIDPEEIQSRLAVDSLAALKESVDRAVLAVHTLEKKESGAFRPHFTSFIWPKAGQTATLETWIRGEVLKRFGSGTRISEEATAQVIRGSQPGQVLFLSKEKGWLMASNSEFGWKEVQLTLADRAPSLATKTSFQDIQSQIGPFGDLFFYFSGKSSEYLLPEFGYSVMIDGEVVTDSYREARP
jgi:hypothetical protein